MAASTTLTIRVTPELKARLGRLAEATQRSQSYLAAEAVEVYVQRELEIVGAVLEGLEDVKAGHTSPHEDVMRELDDIIDSAERGHGIAAE